MTNLSDQHFKCVVENLQVGEGGTCEVQTNTSEDFTFVLSTKGLKHNYEQIFNRQFMTKICKNLPVCENFSLCEESLVVVETSDGLQRRGRVISVLDNNMYRIALFDTCSVQTIEKSKLKPLPLEFATIPQFGVRATINGFLDLTKVIKPGMQFTFLITVHKGNSITATFTTLNIDGNIVFEAALRPWFPTYKDTGLKCIKLINKSEVQIVSYCSQHDIYLCPTDEENVDLRHGVCNDVATYCLEAPYMEYLPDPCEIVACQYAGDNIYYRALVLTREKYRVQVSYLDYGNIEYVTLDMLKPLTDNFKQIPKTVVRVRLNNVIHGPLTSRAISFINMIILTDAKMNVTFTDSHTNGVNLVSVGSNENFNRMVNECMTPYWKLALSAGTSLFCEEVFFAPDMDFLSLPESQTFKLFVTHKETHSRFFGCAIDNPMSAYILKDLPTEIRTYCNVLSNDCYTPRTDELCLALWDGEWLRALCLHVNQKGCAVFLIDWGNTELLTLNFVRRMPKDFVDFPTVANVCFIHGLPEKLSDDLQNRLDTLIPLYSSHMVTVVSRKGDEFYLCLPDVMATLVKEGFITNRQSLI